MNLEVRHLCFSYGSREVVHDVSFTAKPGEMVAVLGVNGVGKSTMLKCLNQIHRQTSGEILVHGHSIAGMKRNQLAREIGYVAQNCQFADGSVFDAVLLGRKPFIQWDVSKEDLEIVQNVLARLSLEEFAMRNVLELSGGERQKVAIARALAQQAPILLFDEPTSSLDLKNQLEILSLIQTIVKEQNLTAVVTIHDLNLALRFADRFLAMRDGAVYSFGGSETIHSKTIWEVYGVRADVVCHDGRSVVIPQ